MTDTPDTTTHTTFVLAGGCFWCLDAAYRVLRGVTRVVSGYTGGHVDAPTYDLVCTDTTDHAEAVSITFDPEVIPPQVILDVFFTIHDPTQLNKQGKDEGRQYRSAMFYADDDQRQLFESAKEGAKEIWGDGVVTEISPLDTFWDAEDYHQDFFTKNPERGSCVTVIAPKIQKVRQQYLPYIQPV
jgi:peptide-methionine (S)-S-oxide reductase